MISEVARAHWSISQREMRTPKRNAPACSRRLKSGDVVMPSYAAGTVADSGP